MIQGTVHGHLAREPRRVGDAGAALAVAVSRWSNKDKERVTVYVDVLVWGKRSELILDRFHEGDGVICFGEIYPEEYEHNGKVRTGLKCFASSVEWAPQKRDARTRQEAPPVRQQPKPPPEPEEPHPADGIPF